MYRITVRGIVQGVGFRPFVYRLAKSMNLKGYVKNTGTGCVEIVIDRNVDEFIRRLKEEKPPIAEIHEVEVEEIPDLNFNDFVIEKSGGKKGGLSLPPPDVALCKFCLKELFDPKNRRYLYPFISCTDCGPRFSVAIKLPYDRENTTFNEFPLCDECQKEYWNVLDRRYYAQSIACPKCGPQYELIYGGRIIKGLDAIIRAAELIDEGRMVAIKGIGGYHIACITDDDVVFKLRDKLGRPQQPFAIMARNLEVVRKVAYVSEDEEREMTSYIRPITVLKKRNPNEFFAVAPYLNTIGVMLPYSPLHYILFNYLKSDFIVMTSANKPGEPMYIDDGVFSLELDAYLRHNLKIHNRVDDSVIKFVGRRRLIIRRSRGFVPKVIELKGCLDGLAVGAELYNSITLVKDGKAIVSQYIGNTANFKTFNEFFKRAVDFFTNFIDLKPKYIACDLHPLYNTTNFAERLSRKLNIPLYKVQHHFAHALSVMAERGIDKAIAITVDGVGYGFDGTIWGGEVLLIDFERGTFKRVGRLERFRLIGGDLATKYPLRVLFSLLYNAKRLDLLDGYEKYLRKGESFEIFESFHETGIATTSMGRVLDAVSAMLKICFERTYEGEPAMKLESVVEPFECEVKPRIDVVREDSVYSKPYVDEEFNVKSGDVRVIRISDFIANCMEEYLEGESKSKIAYKVMKYLAEGFAEIVKDYNYPVVASGGVCFNSYFIPLIEEHVDVYVNEKVACGDNGISFGQAYIGKFLNNL
ncbi:carbamoyltransferase HypF [Archaeoglobus profundus]|uniref:Carbamoyltransferase n=1 Tax=Archaeoglobus profundus (strain DSM 5631 / JCM 9629 / NBRC 100127 / Av18) TaxID=572546 RepID=D2RDT6_ARCPA|nr:carbamoyltransferase HypF [Archaeoglobus profundus]ADB58280.1 (NiFe) hydrogenase maturation protein HypF [Archaeoglobus profundus DSM 5631]